MIAAVSSFITVAEKGQCDQEGLGKGGNGLPWCLSSKESAGHAGDAGLIPGLERSPGEGNGSPLQYSFFFFFFLFIVVGFVIH